MTTDPQIRRALVVDDEEAIGRAHARALSSVGFLVTTAASGEAAIKALGEHAFDVILSDIDMPEMNGIALLERVRQHDGDVPVIMITGQPSIETAVAAIEYGALRYLTKPVSLKDMIKVAEDAVRLYRLAKAKRQALELAGGADRFIGDRAGLAASFERTLESLYIAYQPIVSWPARKVFGYEALLRSREPALPHPGAVLDAAERLGRVHELGARIRSKALEPLARMDQDAVLFINLHPHDMMDERLFLPDTPLGQAASRIVLEITERAALDGIPDVQARAATLRARGYRLAIDDLGAGYAGLASFALLEPNVVKLDLSLVRDLHKHATKQTLVRTMIAMCRELGLLVIGECIEVPEERDELARAGCDLMQGYLFAKPGDAFPVPVY